MPRKRHPSGRVQARPSEVVWDYEPTDRQRAFHESPVKFKLYGGAMGGGKALSVDSAVVTPFGWSTMGELREGDSVIDETGSPCRVVWKSDVFTEPTYRLEFSDGSSIVAGSGHQWVTRSAQERLRRHKSSESWRANRRASRPIRGKGKRPDLAARNKAYSSTKGLPHQSVRTTEEIFRTVRVQNGLNHTIDVAQPLILPEIELLIDPYVLGVWLGDGTSSSGDITGLDEEIFQEVANYYPIRRRACHKTVGTIGLRKHLVQLGLLGNKHIPPAYLRSSKEQRIAMLQGLMDTDGYCDNRGQCEFTTVKADFAHQVSELLHSLGIKNSICEGDATIDGRFISKKYRIKFMTEIPAFRLPRKLIRQKRGGFRGTHDVLYVTAVVPVEPVPLQCIQVDSPNQMYLAGRSMIPTHNSVALCMEAIDLLIEFPGNRGYLCRHTLVDLKRSTLETFIRFCPRGIIKKHYKEDRIYEFWNGSELLYGSLGASEDIDRIKSTEFGFFAIDEASETYEDYFLLLASRLRWILPGGRRPRYHGIMASNPEPGWLKDRFVDAQRAQHAFFPALPKDNPYLPSDYVSTMVSQFPEEWIKRYVEGSWDVFEGQVYKEFNRSVHVYRDLEPGPYWQHIRVIDHGYTNPTCCLWAAVDQDGDIWIYDEHYEANLTIPENADIIKAKYPNFNGITLIDPSCFSITQVSRRGRPCSVVDEYREQGIVCLSPYGRDSRVEEGIGINLVKQRLKLSARLMPDGTEVLAPRLRFHENCKNLLREIVKYRWRQLKAGSKGDQNEPESPVDKDNHSVDCLRYLCVYKPLGSIAPPMPEAVPGTVRWEILKIKKQLKYQQMGFAGWD